MRCLQENTVLDYAGGKLSPAEVEAVVQHAEGCAACCELVAFALCERSDPSSPPVESLAGPEFQRLLREGLTGECAPGAIIGGRYRVLRPLGAGGMGAIFEVEHVKLKRSFALKKLSPSLVANQDALARFRREADVLARLRHPNVVEIVDWEKLSDGSPCLVMEYLNGVDLSQRLAEQSRLSWESIRRIGDATLAALSVAHQAGIVHRDLKPSNIFLARDGAGEEHVKLLDFGLSKVSDRRSRLTGDHRLLGTPLYMAPEQAEGRPDVGAAADVWAAGAILYEMASGQRAFAAGSTPAVLARICKGAPAPLASLRSDAPPAFVRLVAAALSHGDDRLRTAVALRAGLREAVSGAALPPLTPTVTALPLPRPRWRTGAVALAVMLAAAAGAALWLWRAAPAPSLTALGPPVPAATAPPPPAPPLAPPPAAPPPASPVELTVSPPHARVRLDGAEVRSGRLLVPNDGRRHLLAVSAPGYQSDARALDSPAPPSLAIELKRERHVAAHPHASPQLLDP